MKKNIFTFVTLVAVSSFAYASNNSANKDGINTGTNETQIASIATKNNENSQKSMLRLSDDIGVMADRINQMADKINAMADKIVKTQEIQSQNLKITEENILKAQKAIASVLQKTDDPEIVKALQSAQSSLKNIISIKTKNIDIKHPVSMKTINKTNNIQKNMNNFGGMDNMGGIGDMGGMGGMGDMGGNGGHGGF